MRVFAVYGFVPTLVWLGFVLAISFMEAPLKFRAAGVHVCFSGPWRRDKQGRTLRRVRKPLEELATIAGTCASADMAGAVNCYIRPSLTRAAERRRMNLR